MTSHELARAGLLCNDAALAPAHRGGAPAGRRSVTRSRRRCSPSPPDAASTRPRYGRTGHASAEHPFDQATRRMTTVHRTRDGRFLVVCKGAPESVLVPAVVATAPEELDRLIKAADELAADGLRVLAVAAATVDYAPDPSTPTGLRLLGLVGIGDPIRRTAAGIAAAFDEAGIRLLLDHRGPSGHRRGDRRSTGHLARG